MSDKINKLCDIIKDINDDIKPEDAKIKLFEIIKLFDETIDVKEILNDETKEQPEEKQEQKQEEPKTKDEKTKDEKNEVIDKILAEKRIKLNNIYKHYKTQLITRKQRDEVKNILVNNKFVETIENKDGKITSYVKIDENVDKFKKWLIDNLE
jgi:hypothetical protein